MKIRSLFVALAITMLLAVVVAANTSEESSIDLKWYGNFTLDGAYDQNLTSHGNYIMWVQPRTYEKDDEQFNMTANQTRFGFLVNDQNHFNDARVGGRLEFDLYAPGAAQDGPMLQLRHAYLTIKYNNTRLLAGQSSDLVSPLNPSTLNYAVLWGCGNIGYRRPQVSLWQTIPFSDQSQVTMAGGFFRTIGSDLTPSLTLSLGEVSEGVDDGTDAGIPSFQGLFEIKHDFSTSGSVRIGASGLWGQLKAETSHGKFQTYESWAAVGHLQVDFSDNFGLSGEAYTGANLTSYLGGILQNSTINGVETMGGWASAWIKPSPKFKFTAGFGLDDPKDETISSGRSRNMSYFGNITYNLLPQASVGIEVSQWKTEYKYSETAQNLRAQTSFNFSF